MERSPVGSPCVCTSLRMATRAVARRYDRALGTVGLTAGAYSILARLDREGPQALGVLAAGLAMDRTTLSREVAPLVDRGLVLANPGEHDRRQRVLALSRSGRGLVRRARPLWAKAQEEVAEAFGGTRTEELLRELHALVGAAR